jgi:AcrR family transcriptional regulator
MTPKADVATERKEQIYQAALTCFNRKGYYQTTMDDIVSQSGLSKGALYWYFKSKKELFISLLQVVMEPMAEQWGIIVADESLSATEKLVASLAYFRGQADSMIDFFGIMLEAWAQTHMDPDVEQLTREIYKPYLANMIQIVEEGAATGEFQVDSAEATAAVILTVFDGLTLAIGVGMVAQELDGLWDAAEQMVLRGVGVQERVDRER